MVEGSLLCPAFFSLKKWPDFKTGGLRMGGSLPVTWSDHFATVVRYSVSLPKQENPAGAFWADGCFRCVGGYAA